MADKVVPPQRGVFHVTYYVLGQPVHAFVCSVSESAAISFLGIRDGSSSVSRVAFPVEVDGLDDIHPPLPLTESSKVPPVPAEQLSQAELVRLRKLIP